MPAKRTSSTAFGFTACFTVSTRLISGWSFSAKVSSVLRSSLLLDSSHKCNRPVKPQISMPKLANAYSLGVK